MRPQAAWPRSRTALLIVLVLGAAAALWHWREPVWDAFTNRDFVQERVASLGPWGPAVSVSLNAAQVLVAPVPGHIIGLMNGYLYGVWLGTVYSMLGLLVGTALAIAAARFFGRPLVERLINPATLARWDRLADRRGPVFFFLVFLVPGLPDDIVCFIIGLSRLPIPGMVLLAMLGRLPGVFVSCWFGARAAELPAWAWIPLIAGTVGLAWAYLRYQTRLEAVAVRAIEGLTRRPTSTPSREPCAPGTGHSAPE